VERRHGAGATHAPGLAVSRSATTDAPPRTAKHGRARSLGPRTITCRTCRFWLRTEYIRRHRLMPARELCPCTSPGRSHESPSRLRASRSPPSGTAPRHAMCQSRVALAVPARTRREQLDPPSPCQGGWLQHGFLFVAGSEPGAAGRSEPAPRSRRLGPPDPAARSPTLRPRSRSSVPDSARAPRRRKP